MHQILLHPVLVLGITAVTARSSRQFARHTHDQFGIGVVEAGAQWSASGRGQVWGQAGDVITVNPGEVHDGVPATPEGRQWRMLYLDPLVMTRLTGRAGEFSHPVLREAPMAAAVRRLFQAVTDGKLDLGAEVDLVVLRQALGDDARPNDLPAPVALAVEVLQDDPARAVTLSELAAGSGLSRFHFLRSFAKATGLTPHAFQMQARLHLARRLISQGHPLADVALTAGFADQSHLTRLFQRSFGMTPGVYSRNFLQDRARKGRH